MKNILILFLLLFVKTFAYPQFTYVYYYKGVGTELLTFKPDSTFESIGSLDLAKTIEYSGKYLIKGDSLYLYQSTPTIIDKVDTVQIHSSHRTEILTKIDSLTYYFKNSYYKLQKVLICDKLIDEYNYIYDVSVINHSLIWNYPSLDGYERHYDINGKLHIECLWKSGALINCH